MFQKTQKKKQSRVYVDRPETAQMKQQITQKYIQKIMPYELMIEAISLQNKTIQKLQTQYLQKINIIKSLTKQNQPSTLINVSTQNPITSSSQFSIQKAQLSKKERSLLSTYQNQLILQRKRFIEQGLRCNEKKYDIEYQREKQHQNEQIRLKKELICAVRMNQINVFVNFDQGILEELVQFGERKDKGNEKGQNKKEQQQNKQENNKEKVKQSLLGWKKVYEKQVVSNQI